MGALRDCGGEGGEMGAGEGGRWMGEREVLAAGPPGGRSHPWGGFRRGASLGGWRRWRHRRGSRG